MFALTLETIHHCLATQAGGREKNGVEMFGSEASVEGVCTSYHRFIKKGGISYRKWPPRG